MANNIFDRAILNARERPTSSDINQLQSQLARTQQEFLRRAFSHRVTLTNPAEEIRSGFFQDGFRVVQDAGMNIKVTAGIGFQSVPSGTLASGDTATGSAIGSISGLDDLDSYKPMVLTAAQSFTVPAAPGAGVRVDIIEVRADRIRGNPLSRDVLNTVTAVFEANSVNKTMSYVLDGQTGSVVDPASSTADISYKQGPVNAGGAVYGDATPAATTSGYIKIAEIFVPTGTAAVSQLLIGDFRPLLFDSGICRVSGKLSYTAASGKCTLSSVIAPPGVLVGIDDRTLGADSLIVDIYIAAGSINSTATASLQAVCPANATRIILPVVTSVTETTIPSAAIRDAIFTDSPAVVSMAVGQPVTKVVLAANKQASGATSLTVDENISVLFQIAVTE